MCASPVSLLGASEKVLYSFSGGADGGHPAGNLVADAQGNLYGTTYFGGTGNCGTAFELSRSKSNFEFSVIWNFQKARAGDGCHANGGLALDSEGHLYGTTSEGGAYKPPLGKGGTVFQLTRSGAVWSESVLWSFGGTSDGYAPRAGLTVDAKGNLYGTTSGGGGCCGTVFELEKTSGWTELQLHVFTGRDGARPASPVIFDKDGNLNGTAFNIKDGRGGVTFRMFEASTGWKISVLQVSADSSDLSLAGNLGLASIRSQHYGVRPGNGRQDHGSVFTRSDQRVRTSETVVYSFAGPPRDGEKPNGVIAAGGRLYGTTAEGGEHEVGTVFELTP